MLDINVSTKYDDKITDIIDHLINFELFYKDDGKSIKSASSDNRDFVNGNSPNGRTEFKSNAFAFRDVEDIIRKFNGKDNYPVWKWIEDIEGTADLMGWTTLQLFIFARKSLTGLAQLFVQGERNIKNWDQLKAALLDEFPDKL